MSEKQLTNKIIAEARKRGHWCMKIGAGPYQRPGIPDLLIVANGLAVFVEVKIKGNKPSSLQLAVIRELNAAGVIAGVAYSVEESIELMEQSVTRT